MAQDGNGRLNNLESSKFFIDIKNELGLNYKKVRGDLLATSLAKPQNYYALRNDIISSMTEAQVERMYEVVWRVLRNGQAPNGNPFVYQNASDRATQFVPQIPEHIIGELASKAARTIENLMEEIIEEILPDDYLALAQNRQKQILKSKGVMDDA
jgi:hypothetical protein